jgi:diguanylate cyclase (GGDEF)-like protein
MDLPGSLRGHADGDPVRDALASILRTLGELSLPTIAVSREEFVLSCDRLARAILVGPSKLEQEQSMDLKHACGQARSTVRKQRQAESKEYAAHKEGATIIVADLVSNLKTALAQRSDGDAEVVRQLNSIEQAVSIGNLEEIRRVSSIAASGIRKMLSEQQARDEERLACLSQKLVEMKSELDEAKAEAILDPLTELTNRAGLERALEDALAASRAGASDLTLYMIDIDFFKKVNDAYGHPAGDEVLRKVSRQLIRAFPRKDDVVARFGGEEFVALCRSVGEEHAPMLAERARASVEKLLIDTENDTVAVTISIGFAVHRRGESGAEILKRADEALYEAKHRGKNRVEVRSRSFLRTLMR